MNIISDPDGPERRAEFRWLAALEAWLDGDDGLLRAAILDDALPLTADARAFLAGLVAGTVKRGKGGRPPERPAWVERAICAEVFVLRDSSSKEHAVAIVAGRRGLPEGAVRNIVDRMRKQGITRERWIAWGRPTWKTQNPRRF